MKIGGRKGVRDAGEEERYREMGVGLKGEELRDMRDEIADGREFQRA